MAEVIRHWAGKERLFRLDFGRVMELEQACDDAIGSIFTRVFTSRFKANGRQRQGRRLQRRRYQCLFRQGRQQPDRLPLRQGRRVDGRGGAGGDHAADPGRQWQAGRPGPGRQRPASGQCHDRTRAGGRAAPAARPER
ncbi:gene transfer agent family protein [Ferrimonas balearica]|nr:gene transfer agent family protein [Ferrimonas balearica]